MALAGNQLIDTLHRIPHIGKPVLMVFPIRNRTILESIQTLPLTDSKSCFSFVFGNIMDPVHTQDQNILFQLFLIESAAFFPLKEHQRADTPGNRTDRFCYRNLMGITIHLCGRQVDQPSFLQYGPGEQDILQSGCIPDCFSLGIFSG